MKKLLVCGGRNFYNKKLLFNKLNNINNNLGPFDVLIHGAASGADSLAGAWAKHVGIEEERFPADWGRFGKAAGMIRNQKMLDEGKPNLVVAFVGGRGTADMIARAKKHNIEVIEIKPTNAGLYDYQIDRLNRLIQEGAVIAYYCTNNSNHKINEGVIEEVDFSEYFKDEIEKNEKFCEICTNRTLKKIPYEKWLHGTLYPHRVQGTRVWIVALTGHILRNHIGGNQYEILATQREVIGEVLPEYAINESVGARLFRKDLFGLKKNSVYLADANFSLMDLSNYNFSNTFLYLANFNNSILTKTNFTNADLSNATLINADVKGANFTNTSLCNANLIGVNLQDAILHGVDLSNAYYPKGDIPIGWARNNNGYLKRNEIINK